MLDTIFIIFIEAAFQQLYFNDDDQIFKEKIYGPEASPIPGLILLPLTCLFLALYFPHRCSMPRNDTSAIITLITAMTIIMTIIRDSFRLATKIRIVNAAARDTFADKSGAMTPIFQIMKCFSVFILATIASFHDSD